jgi:hypothetical protein
MQEQPGENRRLKGKHRARHPFEDGGIGLERRHIVVTPAENGSSFQSLVLGDVDRAERLENFRLHYRQSLSPLLARLPSTWNHLTEKEALHINTSQKALVE